MTRCKKLRNHFYGMDLFTGKTILAPNRNFHRFFLAEHTYTYPSIPVAQTKAAFDALREKQKEAEDK